MRTKGKGDTTTAQEGVQAWQVLLWGMGLVSKLTNRVNIRAVGNLKTTIGAKRFNWR